MPTYIVRPRRFRALANVTQPSMRASSEVRTRQIAAVAHACRVDPVQVELAKWFADAKVRGPKLAAGAKLTATAESGQGTLPTTTVVEMSEPDADRLRREVPEVSVLRDQPLPLIRPQRVAAADAKPSKAALWHLQAIGLEAARKAGFKGRGNNVGVAVLDTGIAATHPELAGRVGDTVRFDVQAWRAVPQAKSVDTDGHGTHVAGLICGKTVGVAPAAKVMNGIMIPGGEGMLSDFVLALEWAAARPDISIVNMSAGIPGFVDGMASVIEDLFAVGVLPLIATGNEGRNRTRSPGNYDSVVSVGAATKHGTVASFSSSGTLVVESHEYTVPDLVAPGAAVTSCVMDGGYEAWDGTSMATPVAAGVAALVLERFPDISVTDLMEELIGACKDLGAAESRQGAGLVQVPKRLLAKKSKAKPKPK